MSRAAGVLKRALAKAVSGRGLNSAEVTFHSEVPPSGEGVLESDYPEEQIVVNTVRGLVHFVGPRVSGFRAFGEIEAGDVILDFPGDAQIPRSGWFTIEGHDGQRFEQKDAGEALSEYWDVVIGGRRMVRTVLGRPLR